MECAAVPYSSQISRDNPTCFLFLIDQSSSMSEEFAAGKGTQRKAIGVSDTINQWLQDLSIKCAKSDGVRDYFHVGVIGYGKRVGPSFVGPMAGRELAPISQIADNPARIEERSTKVLKGADKVVDKNVKIPVWFDPVADGGTPMCRAAADGQQILEGWLAQHPSCFPPVVIHVTDGEATDGDPADRLRALSELASSDGRVLLFNIHLSANPQAKPIVFPASPDGLPDEYARMLFETASLLTPTMRALAKEYRIPVTDKARGFVLNADLSLLIQAIDIGTRPGNLR
jgi:hypothetical protein